MKLEKEILINQYGQDLLDDVKLLQQFIELDLAAKRIYLDEFAHLILQSKAINSDIKPAIKSSGLKETYTPCIIISKGIAPHILDKLTSLPEKELEKVLKLFLHIFKIAYQRRYEQEKNDPHKWWYWDLSNKENIEAIKRLS